MRMARMNVYLPDDLAERVKRAELNVSRITQDAIRRALAGTGTDGWLERVRSLDPTDVTHARALQEVASARDEFGS
jgi:post-segregation antitoxin (ccd killing protein)